VNASVSTLVLVIKVVVVVEMEEVVEVATEVLVGVVLANVPSTSAMQVATSFTFAGTISV